MNKELEMRLAKSREELKKYGDKSIQMPKEIEAEPEFIPSPSLMLDYKLGGGFRYKHAYEVYGAPSIGKSSAIGYTTLGNAVRLEKGINYLVAVEHRSGEDKKWMEKLGLNADEIVILEPANIEQVISMIKNIVETQDHSLIVVDSIGALGSNSEFEKDSKDGFVKKAYGISGVLTAGLNVLMPSVFKNDNCLVMLNQQRQKGSGTMGQPIFDSVGGEAIKHHVSARLQLKPGAYENRIRAKKDETEVVIGEEIACTLQKMSLNETRNEKAHFTFISKEADGYKVGIEKVSDVINTGTMTGVIRKGGAWLYHDSFPDGKLQGKNAVKAFLDEKPEAYDIIRKDVLGTLHGYEDEEAIIEEA
jgi:recombination protein RecA